MGSVIKLRIGDFFFAYMNIRQKPHAVKQNKILQQCKQDRKTNV